MSSWRDFLVPVICFSRPSGLCFFSFFLPKPNQFHWLGLVVWMDRHCCCCDGTAAARERDWSAGRRALADGEVTEEESVEARQFGGPDSAKTVHSQESRVSN